MKNIITMLAASLGCTLAAPAACRLPPAAWSQAQGVRQSEIVVGSIQDLSGPIAGYGKQARAGMPLRVDEVNEQGGIHGRKIRQDPQ